MKLNDDLGLRRFTVVDDDDDDDDDDEEDDDDDVEEDGGACVAPVGSAATLAASAFTWQGK
jgi:hypothetical protein